jgi:hypothetical protein
MDRFYQTATIIAFFLVSSWSVSACGGLGRNQAVLIFPSEAKIDWDVLQNYCGDKRCKISSDDYFPSVYKTITFQVESEGQSLVFIASGHQETENSPEINSLYLTFVNYDPLVGELTSNISRWLDANYTFVNYDPLVGELTSKSLRLLIANNIIHGISAEDVKKISDIIVAGNIVYYKPSGCGNSYFQLGDGDVGKYGWLLARGSCEVENFTDGCPKIGCYRCGSSETPPSSGLVPLIFTNAPLAEFSGTTGTLSSSNDPLATPIHALWAIGAAGLLIIGSIMYAKRKKK